MSGGHWISAHGVDSDVYVPSNYNSATVNGFYVTDALYNSGQGGYYFTPNTYVTASDFMQNGFTPVSGSWWNGYHVSVERNADQSYNRGSYIDLNSFSHY